ncbi:membrane-associated guanylate kinase, WW and PDZ domain-containing protein 1 isoform X2 [Condylostylus longicornis]|uniref:membrane-associated guanylate kinase, WW and PDZ domain-containing protein 1 isoform X2 n=1 Tax=Condylostylus longicornis TaxID=2530218 RepID=UPI00244DC069|nr:membrane-associated guanylate kinase, WW and PDZ domain-containing protein 1 isoform X2 [Condylostylus longicornis]
MMTSNSQTTTIIAATAAPSLLNPNVTNNTGNNISNNNAHASILSAVIDEQQKQFQQQLQHQQHQQHNHPQQHHHINTNGNSNQQVLKNLNNNNNSNMNNSSNSTINNVTISQAIAPSATLLVYSNTNFITTASSTKSETSSNGSISGESVKKISSSTSTLMNNSREDIRSIDGTSSLNSNIITNNHDKDRKDINSRYFNDLPPVGAPRFSTANNPDDDDGLGPLPPKWEKAYTESGELYFIDHNTGTSHWLDPRLSKFQKKSLEDCSDDELPYGWEKIDDPQYGTYFIDHVNRRTQYENPVLEAKRRIERNRSSSNNSHTTLINHNTALNNSNRQQQPQQQQNHKSPILQLPYTFTRNPNEMQGERITTTLLKSSRGLGITIVGGDDNIEEFLQIKSIVPNGPAWLDGKLQTGDVLVYVNDTCVLGFTHHEMVNVFQSILPGETVTLEICRGYPLPFDPNDPNTEVVTTIAVDGISAEPGSKSRILIDLNMDGNYNFLELSDTVGAVGGTLPPMTISQKHNPLAKIISSGNNATGKSNDFVDNYVEDEILMSRKSEILQIPINKGVMGFGFTITDSAYGQKVKKILDRNCCKNLQEGDILLEINSTVVKHMSHSEVVKVLKECSKTMETVVKIQRGLSVSQKLRKTNTTKENIASGLYRSKTPTADLYSTQPKEVLPIRPKTPLVDTRRARVKTPSNELNEEVEAVTSGLLTEKNLSSNFHSNEISKSIPLDAKSNNSLHEVDSTNNDIPFMDPYPKLVSNLTERLAEASLANDNQNLYHPHSLNLHIQQQFHHNPFQVLNNNSNYDSQSINQDYNTYGTGSYSKSIGSDANELYSPPPPMPIMAPVPTYHHETCYCYNCQDYNRYLLEYQAQGSPNMTGYSHPHSLPSNGRIHNQKRFNDYIFDQRKSGFSPLENSYPIQTPILQQQTQHHSQFDQQNFGLWKYGADGANNLMIPVGEDEFTLSEVTLERQTTGFGFRIVGGTEEGSQVTVGHIVPGGSADGDPRIATGDEILSIDGVNVVGASHHKVVQLMGEAASRGQVNMILRRRINVNHNANDLALLSLPQTLQHPYDVVVSRHENEGFGFVIISSSNQFYGSTIGKIMPGSPADRCTELKVGDRIIAVNRIDIAGMSHGEVVNLIKESGLHVRLTIGGTQNDTNNSRILSNTNHEQYNKQQFPHHHHHRHQQQQLQQPILTAAIKKQTDQQNTLAAQTLNEFNEDYIDRQLNNQHPHL